MKEIEDSGVELAMGITFRSGQPFIESRARVVGGGEGPIPSGKVLIRRTPILPPWAPDAEVDGQSETELVDDDGNFCPLCVAEVHGHAPGRNDPCPCGSGRKFKKCCMS